MSDYKFYRSYIEILKIYRLRKLFRAISWVTWFAVRGQCLIDANCVCEQQLHTTSAVGSTIEKGTGTWISWTTTSAYVFTIHFVHQYWTACKTASFSATISAKWPHHEQRKVCQQRIKHVCDDLYLLDLH